MDVFVHSFLVLRLISLRLQSGLKSVYHQFSIASIPLLNTIHSVSILCYQR